jgi:transposase
LPGGTYTPWKAPPFHGARAKRTVFLIVDRGPAHIAKKTKAFVATLGSRLKLFYLPTYSPDRNPDELVWKHLKADTVGRMVTTSKADFKSKVLSSMRSQKPSLQYAA